MLQRIRLENVKCFEALELDFTQGDAPRLMTVILGDNGMGKSTLLQSLAAAWEPLSPVEATRTLLLPPEGPSSSKSGEWGRIVTSQSASRPSVRVTFRPATRKQQPGDRFGCGYGPFRRLSQERGSLAYFGQRRDERAERFASLFGDNQYLVNLEDWLIELDRRAFIEERDGEAPASRQLFERLTHALFTLLPAAEEGEREPSPLKVTKEDGVLWQDRFGNWVPLSALSDGYQSMMAWAGDLVTRLSRAFPAAEDPLGQAGTVLIDEIDVHLHPRWQRQVLDHLRRTFPRMQFIVTTHSPLVAAGAREGELFALRREGNQVVVEAEPSVQGWRADQILTSDLFGLETTRDPETEQRLKDYDRLVARRAKRRLKPEEAARLSELEESLRDTLPAPGETEAERDLEARMQAYIERTLGQQGQEP